METKIKQELGNLADFIEAQQKLYGAKFDIRGVVSFTTEALFFNVAAFKPDNSLKIVAFVSDYVRCSEVEEATKKIKNVASEFADKIAKYSSEEKDALLTRKAELEAELATINVKLDN